MSLHEKDINHKRQVLQENLLHGYISEIRECGFSEEDIPKLAELMCSIADLPWHHYNQQDSEVEEAYDELMNELHCEKINE